MELSGVRFGRLTAQKRTSKGSRVAWECTCACGGAAVVAQVDLRSGDTSSCGCLRRELVVAKNATHGMSRTVVYTRWLAMWNRVSSKRRADRCYADVSVCARWEKFEAFYADMGEPPDKYSLDRIDNTQGYSPQNCRWVPLPEQARNTRRLRIHNGVHISEAARRAGLSPDVVLDRINKLGWDVDKALCTPVRTLKRHKCS